MFVELYVKHTYKCVVKPSFLNFYTLNYGMYQNRGTQNSRSSEQEVKIGFLNEKNWKINGFVYRWHLYSLFITGKITWSTT